MIEVQEYLWIQYPRPASSKDIMEYVITHAQWLSCACPLFLKQFIQLGDLMQRPISCNCGCCCFVGVSACV